MSPSEYQDLVAFLGKKFDRIDVRFDGLEARVGGLEGRMEGLEGRMEGLEGRMEGLEGRMEGLDGRMEGLDGRMEGVAGGAAFLLCRRPSRMNRHAGQWALPGGRLDPGETALDAALREVDEEIGLRLGTDSVVGWLDDYPTRSGYVITPVVLWGGADLTLHPSPDEVLALYRVGLHALRDGIPRQVAIRESDRPVIQVPLGQDLIHAPTGAVLYQFRQVALLGEVGTRVDHLEQPVFAWR